jgi:hypothetical protein
MRPVHARMASRATELLLPYLLVLDLDEFSVLCRTCYWRSARYPTADQACGAFDNHSCPGVHRRPSIRMPVRVRLAVALAEVRDWRLHRCLVCGRLSLRLQPANQDMQRGLARTWVCTDRPACRQRRRRG